MTEKFHVFAGSDGEVAEEAASEEVAVEALAEEKEAAPAETAPKEVKKSSMTDAEAKLLKEVMKRKEELAKANKQLAEQKQLFDSIESLGGIELFKEMVETKKAQEAKHLAEQGEWDKLKAQMSEEHAKAMADVKKELESLKAANAASQKRIVELTIGSQFATSPYINEQITLPPSKARAIYESYFEIENDKVVGYDKPRGEEGRVKLVDQYGAPLGFDAALAKIVESDPDANSLIRSKMKSGSGSATKAKAATVSPNLTAQDRIASGLASLFK
jgi:hypothetical protein